MSNTPRTNRRDFLRSASLLSAAAAVPLSTVVTACGIDAQSATITGRSIHWEEIADKLKGPGIYSTQNEGIWTGKAGSHAPQVTVTALGIQATTPHPQGPEEDPGHYVLCHFVEAADGTIFDFRVYTRFDTAGFTTALYVPETYIGSLTVYQYCTKHDLWATPVT